jgi:glycosyltransferase involved in cell wall biosynthesis
MTAMPTLSLILCTYQRTTELDRLFQSLAAQTFKDFEVIVVDQNTDDRLSPYLDKGKRSGIDIKHIQFQPPNLSAARNIGIQSARGGWVGFPDDDCWYERDLLEQLSPCFACTDALTGAAARWAEHHEPAGLPLHLTWKRSRLFRDRMVASFMLFFNRHLFDHIGGFDPRLGVGQWFGAGEETDLIMRALRAGGVLTFHPSARVHHPNKELAAHPDTSLNVRRRARGAGALYAKHRLPYSVIVRGLVAPVLRPLVTCAGKRELVTGYMVAAGRWDGMLHWRRLDRRSAMSYYRDDASRRRK